MPAASTVELAHELRDLSACLRRVPPHCLRDGALLVEWLSDQARRADRAANLLAGTSGTRSEHVSAPAPETRFTAGRFEVRGPTIIAERRRRAA